MIALAALLLVLAGWLPAAEPISGVAPPAPRFPAVNSPGEHLRSNPTFGNDRS